MNQHMSDETHEKPQNPPIFNLPGIILLALLILVAVHVIGDVFLSDQQYADLLVATAFIPQRYLFPIDDQLLSYVLSPLSYSFLHGGYGHLAVNSLWLAAFGSIVARRLGVFRFCLFWVLSSVAAAMFFLALNWGQVVFVIGASGVVSALMGASARFAFPLGGQFVRENAHFLPRQSFFEVLQNKTVLVYLAIWFAINLIPVVMGGSGAGNVDSIAWEAHIGGFAFGFLFFGLFDHKDW